MATVDASDADFESWVSKVGDVFKTLSNGHQNRVLDVLVELSGPRQLYHLHGNLQLLLKRDFLGLLPEEVCENIIQYLDPWALLLCEQVSPRWSAVITGCRSVWRNACLSAGVPASAITADHDAAYLRKLFVHVNQRLDELSTGPEDAFSQTVLPHSDARVTALYYWKGILGIGSDDRTVKLWDCETETCIKTIQAHSVAALKFDDQRVLTASFDCSAACWDVKTGQRVQLFMGHVAAVWALDYNESLDVLVTGSADSSVKIWKLSDGSLLNTLEDSADMMARIVILPSDLQTLSTFSVLGQERDLLTLWQISKTDYETVAMKNWISRMDDLTIVPTVKVNGTRASFMAHGIRVGRLSGSNVQFTVVADLKGKTDVDEYFATSGRDAVGCLVPTLFWVAGLQYQVGLKGSCNTIEICNGQPDSRGKFIGNLSLHPYTLRVEKVRGSTVCLCDQQWMDGLDGHNDSGAFLAARTTDNDVLLLKWKPVDTSLTRMFVSQMTALTVDDERYFGVTNFT